MHANKILSLRPLTSVSCSILIKSALNRNYCGQLEEETLFLELRRLAYLIQINTPFKQPCAFHY